MPTALAAAFLCIAPVVHDGDGLRCGSERIRIASIDAPELPDSPKCKGRRAATAWCDFEAGQRSKEALQSFVLSGPVKVRRVGIDRYGRTLAVVTVNGKDAGAYLVNLGLARWWR